MKTTVEIADALLDEAKRRAERERTTLRALIEEGLRRLLSDRERQERFTMRRVTFGGEGMDPEIEGWDDVRRQVYEGRGA
jgi:hypothetical protein